MQVARHTDLVQAEMGQAKALEDMPQTINPEGWVQFVGTVVSWLLYKYLQSNTNKIQQADWWVFELLLLFNIF